MGVILKNNAASTIATAISASDIGVAVASGAGSLFPTLSVGDYFYATIVSTGGTTEIVKVTARVGDSMTIMRAQEGTTARSFASGSRFEARVTAASVTDLVAEHDQASEIGFTPTGTISSTNVQSAVAEVSTDLQAFAAEPTADVMRVGQMKLSYVGTGLMLDQEQADMRGELYLNPKGNDLFAAGELTCLAYDRRLAGRELGTGNNAAFVFYFSRDGAGTTTAGRIRTISTGTEPQKPIEIDSTGGTINAGFRTNGKGWYYNELQIGGTWADPDVAGGPEGKLRIGPCVGPTIDFDDTYNVSSRKAEFRNLGGVFALINLTAGTIPWQVDLSTRTTTMHNVVTTGTITVTEVTGQNLAFTTTTTTTRPGDFRNTNSAYTSAIVFAAHSNTSLGSAYFFQGYDLNTGTSRVLIYDNGNIQNTNNSYGAISDRKFKQDIKPASSQWDDVKALSSMLSKYRLKAEVAENPKATEQLGLIAQDVLEVSPGLVSSSPSMRLERVEVEKEVVVDVDGKDGKSEKVTERRVVKEEQFVPTGEQDLSVKYSVINLKVLGALGEAMTRIEALEAKIKRMERNTDGR